MLAAFGPACITEVTRLTIQVPAKAATSQAGVAGRCATAVADERGDQGDLGGHVAEHVDPGAGGAALAGHPGKLPVGAVQGVRHLPADQREQADRPGRHVAGGDPPGERHHGDRGGQPEHQVGEGQRGRAQPEPLGDEREDRARATG